MTSAAEPAVMERATLLANHVLRSEPVALQRLQPHVGKALRVELVGWPALLPPLPALSWRVTPAGLLEWRGREADAAAELTLRIDASNPAALLMRAVDGQRPQAAIEGEAALAEDVGWLLANLRWDLAADLERVLPPAAAQLVIQFGRVIGGALRGAIERMPAPMKPGA